MIPVNKLGWMAGVIDLKGRLVYKNNKQRKTQQTVLMVENKEMAVIRELGSLTGTAPELIKAKALQDWMRRGCVDHCPEPHVHVSEYYGLQMPRMARWTITGAGMVVVLDNLMPFLMVDRGYDEAIEKVIASTPLVGQGSGQVQASLRRLKSMGWDLPEQYEHILTFQEVEVGA